MPYLVTGTKQHKQCAHSLVLSYFFFTRNSTTVHLVLTRMPATYHSHPTHTSYRMPVFLFTRTAPSFCGSPRVLSATIGNLYLPYTFLIISGPDRQHIPRLAPCISLAEKQTGQISLEWPKKKNNGSHVLPYFSACR